jgi:ketosteroid isomerase-like protein
MNPRRHLLFASLCLPMAGCATRPAPASRDDLVAELFAAETGFAATMAARDVDAFATYLGEDAVFINGSTPLRGRDAIVAHWKRFFSAPQAPFAWKPEIVEVGAGGSLGYTEGPVWTPAGTVVARFATTWQRIAGGRWLVVFDHGNDVCKS